MTDYRATLAGLSEKYPAPGGNGSHTPAADDLESIARQHGLDDVRSAVLRANRAADGDDEQRVEPVLRTMADVEPREVEWLWPKRVPRGKITLLAGDPGLGKSFATLSFAARVSTGSPWPDGSCCPAGDVILVSAEDDVEDTIAPRLIAHGADLDRVHALEAVRVAGRERAFTLEDLPPLRDAIARVSPILIVIDPISSFLGRTDSHNNAEVRGLLAPLAKMAADTGAAVLLVSHLNKSGGAKSLYRATGSLAFVAAARAAYFVCRDRDDPKRRLFAPGKNNLGDDQTGFAYSIVDGVVRWDPAPLNLTADRALEQAGDGASGDRPGPEPEERNAARDWLLGVLKDGPVESKQIQADARACGISWATVRRAKTAAGVIVEKAGLAGGWTWRLRRPAPGAAEDAHVTPCPKQPEHLEHLERLRADGGTNHD